MKNLRQLYLPGYRLLEPSPAIKDCDVFPDSGGENMNRRNLLKSVTSVAAGAGVLAVDPDAVWGSGARAAAPNAKVPAMPFIETGDGTSLYYQDWGKGKPVVFSHGGAVGGDMWEYQMVYLASQGLRCIAHDRRGCGRSSQPGYGYDFDTFADDLRALIEKLDLHEVTLVGHSIGGGEIARYLSRHGAGRISRIVLVASVTPFLVKTADNPDGIDKSVFEHSVAQLSKDRPHYFAATAPAFFGAESDSSVSPELLQWGIRLVLRASLKATIDMIHAQSGADFRPDMRAFTVPTLIIHGDRDQSAPIELSGRRTARLIAGSELKVYPGAPHGLMFTHTDRLNADLLTFIKA
jgi:non-heme chloroperoxidase